MKQTYSVNIGGTAFNIDNDAYMTLKTYLDQIEVHFSNEEGGKEIMDDIETRISELFQERVKSPKEVIDLKDVKEVMEILGDPDEIGEQENGSSGRKKEKFGPSGYRRIYRDPDNRVLGGVCSGMGAYWQIDPLVFRLLFIVAFLVFGVGLVLYLILWIVIPEAKTAAQKLEMRGEPVNISNIGKAVKEEFENVRDRMNL
jgi:phage shock protein PspC (stress-responsive transcriptional regulator)